MTSEIVKISTLKPHQDNPRDIKKDKLSQLKQSIKEFPEMLDLRPLVVDENNVILGGNMRYHASIELGIKEIPIIRVLNFTPEQKKEFTIKDNVSFGMWDWDKLANEWDNVQLEAWGMDVWQEPTGDEFGDEFGLPDGDKSPFEQQTYTLSGEQAEQIKDAITEMKATEEYKYVETFGNTNSNGNALYLIAMKWKEMNNLQE